MKKITFILMSLFAVLTAHASGLDGEVVVLPFGQPIHQLRIYDDTLYVSSDAAISYYPLSEPSKGWQPEVNLDVVVYDFVKCGDRFLDAYTPAERYYQNLQQPGRVYTSVLLGEEEMGYALRMTTDFGQTWQTVDTLYGGVSFAFNPLDDQQLVFWGMNEYVTCICPFLFTSSDGLSSWQNVDFMMNEDRYANIFMDMQFSPTEPGVLVAALSTGLARSEDGGRNWQYTNQGFPDFNFTQVAFDDEHPGVVYATAVPRELPTCHCAYSNYVLRSEDGGRTWAAIYSFETEMNERGAMDIQGLTCYKGKLYFWVDAAVYVLQAPQTMIPITNGIRAIDDLPIDDLRFDSHTAYDLGGRPVVNRKSVNRKFIGIRNGRKYVQK